MEPPAALSLGKSNAFSAIFAGGLSAGVLDLAAAIMSSLSGRGPTVMLQSIASGALGAQSYQGGVATAALGVILHFIIATVASAVYYFASRRLRWLIDRPILCGATYGIAVFFFMRFIVLPLSAVPFKMKNDPGQLATGILIHIFCVGLPIALAIRRYSK